MRLTVSTLMAVAILAGCGFDEAYRRNEDRYAKPGAMDLPLTGSYATYQFNFLDRYRVTHEWLNSSACDYSALQQPTGTRGHYLYWVLDIYEEGDVTKLRGAPAKDFNSNVRSVKWVSKERGKEGEVLEVGFRPMCFESWWTTSHYLRATLFKRDVATWRTILAQKHPHGKWSEQRVGDNVWFAKTTSEQDFNNRPLNGVGGPFQIWLLPIGNTGYTLGFELGASKESLQFPGAHERFKATFRHLIESVRIEPLTPRIEAEHEALKQRALDLAREDCKRQKAPSPWCRQLLQQP